MISKFMFEMWQIVEQLANLGVGAKFWVRVKILMGAKIWVGGEILGWGLWDIGPCPGPMD